MGLVERWGSGTTRIVDELRAKKHPLPQFKSEHGHFRLYFYRAEPVHAPQPITSKLTKRQNIIVKYVQQHGSITNLLCQEIAEISARTATRELKQLTEMGIFVQEGSIGQGTKYRLKHNLITP